MWSVSYAEAQAAHPALVGKVLAELRQAKQDVSPDEIVWFLVECHDDPDELLDEGAIADAMLTGQIPCRKGVCGKVDGHFGCFCDQRMMDWKDG